MPGFCPESERVPGFSPEGEWVPGFCPAGEKRVQRVSPAGDRVPGFCHESDKYRDFVPVVPTSGSLPPVFTRQSDKQFGAMQGERTARSLHNIQIPELKKG